MLGMHFVKHTEKYIILVVCRLGLTAFSKIFDFVKNIWFYITQQKQKKEKKIA